MVFPFHSICFHDNALFWSEEMNKRILLFSLIATFVFAVTLIVSQIDTIHQFKKAGIIAQDCPVFGYTSPKFLHWLK